MIARHSQDLPHGSNNRNRFLSDAQRMVRRHLQDKNHVFTEEEIRSIRVGITLPLDEAATEAINEAAYRAADRKADSEVDVLPGAQKATPWDVLGL